MKERLREPFLVLKAATGESGGGQKDDLRRTLARGAALVRPHDRLGAAGNGTGDEDAHLPARVAVAVAAAVVPAVALLVSASARGEAEAGLGRRRGGGARDVGAFYTQERQRG